MKTLVIAEKPDMGRNIAAVIEPKAKNARTYIEGERYIITWAIGHLIGLAEPDAYDDKYKKWNINDLPIIPEQFKLKPNPKTKDQLKVIAELSKRSDRLINACDAGREGQHIFSLIQQHLKMRQPVQRLWISDLTPETIRKGFDELKDGREYENLSKAARARSEADWLIGMNGSRAFTTKHNVLLSVGRVQTPVLALVYDRQKEIDAFNSAKFYDVEAIFKQGDSEYKGLWQGERIQNEDKAKAIAAKVQGKEGKVLSYDIKDTKEYPFKLYDLTLLQREANAKYSFSAKKTLDLAQALYEKHKVISYPRTTSNYVTEQNIPQMYKSLDQLRGTDYAKFAEHADKKFVHKNNKSVCNPAKVEDHHAILPTNKMARNLAPDEAKIYDLIVRRFLSHFYPPAEYKVHTIMTAVEQEEFKTTIKQLLSEGWKVIYADQKKDAKKSRAKKDKEEEDDVQQEEEVTAPFQLNAKEGVTCISSEAKEKETQPPKPYTEGTLLKAMESAGKQIEDEELRDAMKDSGLGTPATRAAIIERLKQVGYMVMKGKRIVITQKGKMAVEVIRGAGVDLLTSPEMTGQWERRLNEIAKGSASDEVFMANVKKFATMIIGKVKMQPRVAKESFEDQSTDSTAKSSRSRKKPAAKAGGEGNAGETGASSKASSSKAATAVKPRERTSAPVAAASEPRTAVSGIAPCPRAGCGGTLIMGKRGYGCSHYKTGCTFVIWRDQFGVSLEPSDIASLAGSGKTARAFTLSDDGQVHQGKLILLDPDTGTIGIDA